MNKKLKEKIGGMRTEIRSLCSQVSYLKEKNQSLCKFLGITMKKKVIDCFDHRYYYTVLNSGCCHEPGGILGKLLKKD